jgi:hypothetical protein
MLKSNHEVWWHCPVHGWWDARAQGLTCPDCRRNLNRNVPYRETLLKTKQMERMTATTISELKAGDRFYKISDKKRETLVKIEHKPKWTKYRTYKHFAFPAAIYDAQRGIITEAMMDHFVKPMAYDTKVVFLRAAQTKTV